MIETRRRAGRRIPGGRWCPISSAVGLALALAWSVAPLGAQAGDGARTPPCASCAEWNAPQRPFRIYGNSYYVGTHRLSAVLITSARGHVLIDGGLPESAPRIEANIRALGFRMRDVKLILNSHAHFDHAGGIAALRRLSGAAVAASGPSAPVLARGASGADDPQYGLAPPFPPVPVARVVADGDTVRVGPIALVAHLTPGHTPGSTTWSWRACEGRRCLEMVYADSQTPVSADGFRFTASAAWPTALADFERGIATIERLRCDVLLTPHPDASAWWDRVAARRLADPGACRRYAAAARRQLARRVADERAGR
ncbi:MAG TPA: subclass B3 metallo-beta-lactamase [Longimicrobium sp.]|jgi:metallo-beta-lactamase class B|nr:subclass B3 metallo-beta-lactamase [Longimicrobium sp.]